MEKQLFTWRAWDQVDLKCFLFYDVETIVDIGNIPAGTGFASAVIFYDDASKLELYDEDGETVLHSFNLKIQAVC